MWNNQKLAKVSLFGAVYLGAAVLTSQITFSAGSFPTLWLPGGLLLGVLLLSKPANWPAYLLVSLPGNIFYSVYFHQSFLLAGTFYLSNCLEACAGAWLLQRLNRLVHEQHKQGGWRFLQTMPADLGAASDPQPGLASPRDVLLLIVIVGPLSALLSAACQSAMVLASVPGQSYWPAFRSAWTGHMLGVLAVTPLLISWRTFRLPQLWKASPERWIEMSGLLIALVVWAVFVFRTNALFVGRSYVVMPLLVWTALRFGPRGTALSGLLVSIAAALGLVWQMNDFAFTIATIAPNTDLLGGFLTINLVTCYFLTTSFEEGKLTAAALGKSEERYRRLIEAQGEGIGIIDLQEIFRFSNPAGNQIFGIEPNQSLVGRSMREFTQPDQFEIIQRETHHRRTRRKTTYEIEIIRADGQKRQLLVTATPEFDEHGAVNGAFAIFRDITDRKTSEKALRESQSQLQALFDHSPIANWEEDFSLVKQRLDALRQQGIEDFRSFFDAHPEEVRNCIHLIRVLKANQAAVQLCSSYRQSDFLKPPSGPNSTPSDVFYEEIIAISENKLDFEFEGPNDCIDGEIRIHHVRWTVAPGAQLDYGRVIVSIIDVTERKRTEERLRYMSTHDLLTGLYNRNFFETEMERLQDGRSYPINLMVVDVNGMKTTNDTFGHAAGDELLKRTARVLQSAFRKEDIIARIGGDEFVVMFTGELSEKEATHRVRACLDEQSLWNDGQPLSLAIGVASGARGNPLVEVLKKADQQMYREKNRIKRSRGV